MNFLFRYLAVIFLSFYANSVFADFQMKSVSVDVLLHSDGNADIRYAVSWKCRKAQLHGFYFEGFQETPRFQSGKCLAIDHNGRE